MKEKTYFWLIILFFLFSFLQPVLATHIPGHREYSTVNEMLADRPADYQYILKTLRGYPQVVWVHSGLSAENYFLGKDSQSFKELSAGGFTINGVSSAYTPVEGLSQNTNSKLGELFKSSGILQGTNRYSFVFVPASDSYLLNSFTFRPQQRWNAQTIRTKILRHELAHAFYYTDPDFREKVNTVWDKYFPEEQRKIVYGKFKGLTGNPLEATFTEEEKKGYLSEMTAKLFESGTATNFAPARYYDESLSKFDPSFKKAIDNVTDAFEKGEFGVLPGESLAAGFASNASPKSVASLPQKTVEGQSIPASGQTSGGQEVPADQRSDKEKLSEGGVVSIEASEDEKPVETGKTVKQKIEKCEPETTILGCLSALDKIFSGGFFSLPTLPPETKKNFDELVQLTGNGVTIVLFEGENAKAPSDLKQKFAAHAKKFGNAATPATYAIVSDKHTADVLGTKISSYPAIVVFKNNPAGGIREVERFEGLAGIQQGYYRVVNPSPDVEIDCISCHYSGE